MLRDPSDSKYAQSFTIGAGEDDEALSFFREHGFAVFAEVFNAEQCEESVDAMWRHAEEAQEGLHRDDPTTWKKYQSSGKYGLACRGPTFDPTLVDNRQNEKLAAALALVLEIPIEDVMVGHDRFTIYRATELSDESYEAEGEGEVKAEEVGKVGKTFLTGRKNIHLDMNPWWWLEASPDILVGADSIQYQDAQDFIKENNFVVKSMGPHVQCVLNFSDNEEEDGGTIVVPGFHNHLEEWCQDNATLRKPVPFVTFGDKKEAERSCEEALLQRSCRVPMRPGSVLIWNQTLAHGTQPNASHRNRTAQFLKAFSRQAVFLSDELVEATRSYKGGAKVEVETMLSQPKRTGKGKQRSGPPVDWVYDGRARLQRRSLALETLLRESGALEKVTPLGISLFGLGAV